MKKSGVLVVDRTPENVIAYALYSIPYLDKNINIPSLLKTVNKSFLDFKESVDNLQKENDSIQKNKYLEVSKQEIETKFNSLIDEKFLALKVEISKESRNRYQCIENLKTYLEKPTLRITIIFFFNSFKIKNETSMLANSLVWKVSLPRKLSMNKSMNGIICDNLIEKLQHFSEVLGFLDDNR